MKKVLLATTAAICVGGVASAEVSLSGEGKLGLRYLKDVEPPVREWDVVSSANVKFTLSGTSDNEMIGEFGASFTLDASESTTEGILNNPFVVYVGSAAGPFGKIEAGTDLGAGDKKFGGLSDPGLINTNLDDIAEIYYGGSGRRFVTTRILPAQGLRSPSICRTLGQSVESTPSAMHSQSEPDTTDMR